mmetsp:Transcript_7748/g.16584  ORF Transcript_7748/g.16584 Transcript_7748/m.16584 type:complete len:84 (+) Transcript_7748:651-902(+)
MVQNPSHNYTQRVAGYKLLANSALSNAAWSMYRFAAVISICADCVERAIYFKFGQIFGHEGRSTTNGRIFNRKEAQFRDHCTH